MEGGRRGIYGGKGWERGKQREEETRAGHILTPEPNAYTPKPTYILNPHTMHTPTSTKQPSSTRLGTSASKPHTHRHTRTPTHQPTNPPTHPPTHPHI